MLTFFTTNNPDFLIFRAKLTNKKKLHIVNNLVLFYSVTSIKNEYLYIRTANELWDTYQMWGWIEMSCEYFMLYKA